MEETNEIKKLLKRNLEISEESSNIIKKIHGAQRTGRILKILKWFLVIALALGAYYYVQPFMETFWETVGQIKKDFSSLKEASESAGSIPMSFLDQVKKLFEGPK
ncbi:hypothetical protein KJ751_00970 [Patescibacteria group bacterium]|nr:hypothetical protein [Patescibacteria group bacterium]